MALIEGLHAWEALDSRGTPTVACVVRLGDGSEGEAIVPSGASTGTHEAHERRDAGSRYGGKGVRAAVASLAQEIAAALAGLDAGDQELVDRTLTELDGTAGLQRLGANAVLAASVACALAEAQSRRLPFWQLLDPGEPLLPLPMVNVISGGAHAGGLVDIQDFLVVPVGAGTFAEALEWSARVRAAAAEVLRARGHDVSLVADEGGLAAPLPSNRAALDVLLEAMQQSGLVPGSEVAIAVDVAASQLLAGGSYHLRTEARSLAAAELVDEIAAWVTDYPIVSVEDVLGEDDPGWQEATSVLGGRVQVVGDDLFVTSPDRVAAGIEQGLANAVLVKPNQVGTLSVAREVIELARRAGYATVVSARSGETENSWLADLAVGWRAGQIKVGSTTRSERTAKWNRLLRIESQHPGGTFAGGAALASAARASIAAGLRADRGTTMIDGREPRP